MITILFWIISVVFAFLLSIIVISPFIGCIVEHGAYELSWIAIFILMIIFLRWEYNHLPNHKPVYPSISWKTFR